MLKYCSFKMAFSLLVTFLVLVNILSNSMISYTEAQLTPTFYADTCPNALSTIRTAVRTAISRERRIAASLLRLHFHDCFVQGCDASLLLNDTSSIVSEKNSIQNFRSARGFDVIDDVKSKVERACPGIVSCADILAVAARDASAYVGGPTWTVKLGRRDSTSASRSLAEAGLPLATDNLDQLLSLFRQNDLNERDMVALSGAHTIGQAACATFRGRLYNNDTNIDAGFRSTRRRRCPLENGPGNGNLAPLDLVTPNSFDHNYFKNLIQRKGLLHSDQVLFSGGSTDGLVNEYSRNRASFYSDFAAAMVKMGDIDPLTGNSGEIRRICSFVN